jgi:rhodanese-related sulfurtransferase
METTRARCLALAFLLALACAGCADKGGRSAPFITEHGLGPDKWATAWLLTRHVSPGADLMVIKPGRALPPGVHFDVAGSELTRQADRAAFDVVRSRYRIEDPVVAELAQIVQDIEIDFWNPEKSAAAPLVEHAFRTLQTRHGREEVPPECYLAFFDRVYGALRAERAGARMQVEELLVDCGAVAAQTTLGPLVSEVRIAHLLSELGRGKRVVFVDVREPHEYREAHIPGALNVALRDIDPALLARLRGVDYVVSYCVKDFRGFEMARALQDAGVENSVILNPYGIRGWIASGLPTAGTQALEPAEAAAVMARCIAGDCGDAKEL